eukprot:15434746-Alexandrium_andersonii.AAC.1
MGTHPQRRHERPPRHVSLLPAALGSGLRRPNNCPGSYCRAPTTLGSRVGALATAAPRPAQQ